MALFVIVKTSTLTFEEQRKKDRQIVKRVRWGKPWQ